MLKIYIAIHIIVSFLKVSQLINDNRSRYSILGMLHLKNTRRLKRSCSFFKRSISIHNVGDYTKQINSKMGRIY